MVIAVAAGTLSGCVVSATPRANPNIEFFATPIEAIEGYWTKNISQNLPHLQVDEQLVVVPSTLGDVYFFIDRDQEHVGGPSDAVAEVEVQTFHDEESGPDTYQVLQATQQIWSTVRDDLHISQLDVCEQVRLSADLTASLGPSLPWGLSAINPSGIRVDGAAVNVIPVTLDGEPAYFWNGLAPAENNDQTILVECN